MQVCSYLQVLHCTCTCTYMSEFLISFEAWAKLAQQWLVCPPLVIHFEPINKELMQYNHNYLQHLAQRENSAVLNKKLFGPMVCHMSLSKTLIHVHVYTTDTHV